MEGDDYSLNVDVFQSAGREGWVWGAEVWEKTDYRMAFILAADQGGRDLRLELLYDPMFPQGLFLAVLVTTITTFSFQSLFPLAPLGSASGLLGR